MALIECPECAREVSNAAASCPHCGYPLTARSDGKSAQTIEKTAKSIKARQVYAALMLVGGSIVLWPALYWKHATLSWVAGGCMIWGLLWWSILAMRRWWYHG